ncbi:hypothetical protein AtubIFM56815_009238 [Aspergillus tubingensis]|uniref:Uncharacterized protein n=1 Tax=Aspergillus tubingensis TaxID=5068 RepID=A0A9W6AMD7_ASPTU|nr:hypothetical protein AtubIFM56815_009238 [Aspergillus tubingensis]
MPESYVRESVTREDIDSTENPAFVTPSSLNVRGKDVLTRLDRVERQLQSLINAVCPAFNGRDSIDAETGPVDRPGSTTIVNGSFTSSKNKALVRDEVNSFSGETSIRHVLEEVEERLETTQGHGGPATNAPHSQISTPILTPPPHHERGEKSPEYNNYRNIFLTYGIQPKRPQWDKSLDIFCWRIEKAGTQQAGAYMEQHMG